MSQLQHEVDLRMLRLYLAEIEFLCESVIMNCRDLFSRLKPPNPGESYIISEIELCYKTAAVPNDAAKIGNLIKNERAKYGSKESAEQYRFRRARNREMEYLFGDLELKAIYSLGVRRGIEHIDEYLDKICVSGASPVGSSVRAYPLNIIAWDREVFQTKLPKGGIFARTNKDVYWERKDPLPSWVKVKFRRCSR